jgi:hypothetical protein
MTIVCIAERKKYQQLFDMGICWLKKGDYYFMDFSIARCSKQFQEEKVGEKFKLRKSGKIVEASLISQ